MSIGKPTQMPIEGAAFDGAGYHFNVSLPMWAAYKPDGSKRDFGCAEGLLGYVVDIVNAHRDSVDRKSVV